MSAHQALHPVATQCRLLEVSTSGYYAWRFRPASRRARQDEDLTRKIRTIHATSRGTYGVPRVHAVLASQGVHVGRKRVARLMAAADLEGVSRRKPCRTTVRDPDARPAPDLVDRDFTAAGPDRLWVADITYIPTTERFLYLAVVLDAWSRKIVSWAIAASLHADVVIEALEIAIEQRKPKGVIHHSDQGTQYTSIEFGIRCGKYDVRPSMGSVGDAYDNAMCESVFATLECELLNRVPRQPHAATRRTIFEWIEGWYNPHRLHSSLGYLSPVDFERANAERPSEELCHAK